MKKGEFEAIDISEGDILKIRSDGKREKAEFEYTYYYGMKWWDYGIYEKSDKNSYITDLKSIAQCNGYLPEDIDHLISEGFTLEEIEEYLYCGLGCEI